MTMPPRNIAIPFTADDGRALVGIARENNDYETVAYYYLTTAAEFAEVKADPAMADATVALPNGEEGENCVGDWIEEFETDAAYQAARDRAWSEAQVALDMVIESMTRKQGADHA